jgi:hypothetical protein
MNISTTKFDQHLHEFHHIFIASSFKPSHALDLPREVIDYFGLPCDCTWCPLFFYSIIVITSDIKLQLAWFRVLMRNPTIIPVLKAFTHGPLNYHYMATRFLPMAHKITTTYPLDPYWWQVKACYTRLFVVAQSLFVKSIFPK